LQENAHWQKTIKIKLNAVIYGLFFKIQNSKTTLKIMKRVQEINEAKNKKLKIICATCGEREMML
jgi:hypothetical protein